MKIAVALFPLLLAGAAPAAMGQQAAAPAATPAQKPAPKPSSGARKALSDLAAAVTAKNVEGIKAALPAAQAAASTPGDKYLAGMLLMNGGLSINDNDLVAQAVDIIAQSTYLTPAEAADLYKSLGGTFTAAKDDAKAAAAFEKGVALDPNNVSLLTNLAEARFAQGRAADGVTVLRKAIAASAAAGTKAPEAYYRRGVGQAFGAKLPVTTELARDWVRAYPNADSWHNALAIYQNVNQDPKQSIEVYRLMSATNSAAKEDLLNYGWLAFEAGNFPEAKMALDAGKAAGLQTSNADVKQLAEGLAAKPSTTAADLATAAKAVKDGVGYARVADRYMGLGNYAEAAALYRKADGQPGVDADLIKLHLGIALARSGDKAGAAATFAAVGGAYKGIASYWQLYLDTHA